LLAEFSIPYPCKVRDATKALRVNERVDRPGVYEPFGLVSALQVWIHPHQQDLELTHPTNQGV